MTAPTPDLIERLRGESREWPSITELHQVLTEAADALAAVTAERDQARQILADAPHSNGCATKDGRRVYEFPPCDCWKAGL